MCNSVHHLSIVVGKPLQMLLAICVLLAASACGGGGGGGGGGGSGSGNANQAGPSSKLFVADSANFAIASAANANPSPGTMSIDHIIAGPNTGISNNVGNLFIDASNDRLYVANGTSILVFDNAGTSAGNTSPARTITSAQFGNVSSLFLDTTNNILYVGDDLNGIWIIDNANSASGSITPTRSITGNFTASYGGTFVINSLYIDTVRDLLYVSVRILAAGGGTDILVFNSARTANGSGLTPARTIHPSAYAGTIFVDAANDRLYLADPSAHTVRTFDSISAADGTIASNRTISVGSSPSGLAVDTAGNRLYVLNPSAVYIIDSADIAAGSVPMRALLAPSGSMLTAIAVRH